jgi:IS4 transposase
MPHQDQGREDAGRTHADDLYQALRWLLRGVSWPGIKLREDCSWSPLQLVYAALLWAWSDEKTLVERFATSRKIIIRLFPGQPQPAKSYQAFVKLLVRWTNPLLEVLRTAFRRRMEQALSSVWSVAGWVVFAADGSRSDVPRTRSNEQRYSPKSKLSRAAQKRKRGKRRRKAGQRRREQRERKANVPQIWLTVLWHVGSGLPWDWCLGPSDSSERDHLSTMLDALPLQALIAADAGFVGYDLWLKILAADRHLLIRVGGNVRLLKKLGYRREVEHTVYLWPERAAQRSLAPLVLRLIVVHNGRHPVYLVTNLSRQQLSDVDAVAVYRRRWGIELFYRHVKQTFERRKLRSQQADNALVELQWSLLGVWAMGLHSHHRLIRQGVPPDRISFAGVLRAYRRPMREYKSRPDPGERLTELLDIAIIDDYPRKNKASRDYPRKKHETAPGPPQILLASDQQIALAQEIKADLKGLTA